MMLAASAYFSFLPLSKNDNSINNNKDNNGRYHQ